MENNQWYFQTGREKTKGGLEETGGEASPEKEGYLLPLEPEENRSKEVKNEEIFKGS